MDLLDEHSVLTGFFSYAREDDGDSGGRLSALRERIQRELRGQLGRSARQLRLWQDKDAIPSGASWEADIKDAIGQSVFFIPIITPTAVNSNFCRFEFTLFRERERALGRTDLVFPILYIRVAALEERTRWQTDPVLSMIARRQYVDWQKLRHLDVHSQEVAVATERFCRDIVETLGRSTPSEARATDERDRHTRAMRRVHEEAEKRQHAEARRRERDVALSNSPARLLASQDRPMHDRSQGWWISGGCWSGVCWSGLASRRLSQGTTK